MFIRPATAADAAAICDIWNRFIRTTDITFTDKEKTTKQVVEMMRLCAAEHRPFLVLETETVAGFATYAQFRPGPGYAATMEQTIYLSSKAKGQGHGKTLANALEREAQNHGVRSLIAAISASNLDAISFHRDIGFMPVGQIPQAGEKHGRVLDLVLLQKLL